MNEAINLLMAKYGFDDKAKFYLDSIAWQEEDFGFSADRIVKDLSIISKIASRYPSPVAALELFDNKTSEFLRRQMKGWRIGNIQTLNEEELKIRSNKRLDLYGLETRIDQCWLRVNTRSVSRRRQVY